MQTPEKLILENRAWSEEMNRKDPEYFSRKALVTKPEFLWVGCADSGVPAETVVNAQPGEIFEHRNLANQVIMSNFNCLSVLQYAIAVLKVKHVIVCGHYGCGGVKAALQPQSSKLVLANKWLLHIKDVYRLHQEELEAIDPAEKVDRLVELNVVEQVYRLAHTSIIQSVWKHGHKPTLHGWIYDTQDGLIRELIKLDHNTRIHPIYQYTD
ncbi:MAG: carbonic anhydrase [Methylococcaceae bacterium]|nr:carbonic anhydrase [Methylococcaceae bacterium]